MQKRAIETRERILAASVKLFSKKGFHACSVDEIAREARANKERVYAYFESKEGLFAHALKRVYESLLGSESSLLELTADDASRLTERLLEHYMTFHARNPSFWRMLAWCNLESVITVDVIKGIRSKTMAHLRGLYKAGQSRGAFSRRVSFETYIFTLAAVTFFYYANQRTMSRTLGKSLRTGAVRDSVVKELRALVDSGVRATEGSSR